MSGVARALATVGGLGDRLPAPGTTVGSIAGAVLFWACLHAVPGHPLAVALAGLAVLLPASIWACGAEAARRGEPDPHPVVADEVVGQWLALAPAPVALPAASEAATFAIAFVLFRALDVVKPWPIRALERLPGGWGIVADDLAAGAAAGVLTLLALRVL